MQQPTPTFRDFEPFRIACSARNLAAQLAALKQNHLGRLPHQDRDAMAPHDSPGVPKAAAQ